MIQHQAAGGGTTHQTNHISVRHVGRSVIRWGRRLKRHGKIQEVQIQLQPAIASKVLAANSVQDIVDL